MNKFLKIALGLTLAGLGFTACKDTEDDLLPEHIPFTVTDITNVMIPDVSITPGMTLSIPGVGFNQEDTQITLSASDGRTTAPENISLDEMIFFGDGLNDLEVIAEVGLGVAMGNALEEIKDKSKEVTESNNEDGIVKFLDRKLNRQKVKKL